MELNTGELVSGAKDGWPTLFPQDVHVSAHFCEKLITKSKTVVKGLLHHVQTDANTVSAFVTRNVLTVGEGDLLRRETSPPSDRLKVILQPALIRGGNSALERFYWCLRDTQDDGRLGHRQLADAIKERVDQHVDRERRQKILRERSSELASSQSLSQIGTDVGPDMKNTTTSYRHLPKHGGIIAGEMLRPDVEEDVISHPLSKEQKCSFELT